MKEKTQHIGQLIKKCIHEIDPNAEVILYGSRARGDERLDSDWDILILTDYPMNIEIERNFRNRLYDVELETGESLSVFAYSKSDWQTKQSITPFYHSVNSEGVNL